MFRFIFKLLGNGQRLPILIYHQVLPDTDVMRPFEPTAEEFEIQMASIASNMSPVSLQEGVKGLNDGSLPKDAIAVTFDDGYENNFSVALPILQKYGIPATFFVASDFLNGGIMWNDQVLETFRYLPEGRIDLRAMGLNLFEIHSDKDRFPAASNVLNTLKHLPFDERAEKVATLSQYAELPKNLMMSEKQVKALSDNGQEIGGHTLSHPILTKLTLEQAKDQIVNNKHYLENITQKKLVSFAYPNGKPIQDYNSDICSLVKNAGYQIAVTTSHGVCDRNTPKQQLPRYTPWRRNKLGFIFQLMNNYRSKPLFI